ncbi:hypothetical protein [Polymorphospora sp. NPDC050346]|uniref:hypothetical protein n=1 Tax=Polymorphospora sp. NPDC050346 TaxID=3155780 RepID=UPI0033F3FB25
MDHDGRSARTARVLVGLAAAPLAWGSVIWVERRNVPNVSLLMHIGPAVEMAVWLAALVLTGWLLARLATALRSAWASWVAAVVAAALSTLCVHLTNWAVYDPKTYYAVHRYSFDAVAAGVRAGSIGTSDDYYGEPLPWHLRDLSTDGRASVAGDQDGEPVVFLPQWLGLPDDAGGYAYLAGEPRPDLEVNLYGARAYLAGGIRLGNGWWYVLPGD